MSTRKERRERPTIARLLAQVAAEGRQPDRIGDDAMFYVPLARSPWSEIVPGLFQGGHDYQDASSGGHEEVVLTDEFDVVFSLYARAGHGPADGVPHLYVRLPDATLSPEGLDEIRAMADLALEALREGRRVAARCQAGLNRSGLVVAFVLLRMGFTAADAIDRIRAKRSPYALCNQAFVTYIGAEEVRLARERAPPTVAGTVPVTT